MSMKIWFQIISLCFLLYLPPNASHASLLELGGRIHDAMWGAQIRNPKRVVRRIFDVSVLGRVPEGAGAGWCLKVAIVIGFFIPGDAIFIGVFKHLAEFLFKFSVSIQINPIEHGVTHCEDHGCANFIQPDFVGSAGGHEVDGSRAG